MSSEELDAMQQAILDHDRGYDERWHHEPFDEDASDSWKAGWREADYELSGNEDAEF